MANMCLTQSTCFAVVFSHSLNTGVTHFAFGFLSEVIAFCVVTEHSVCLWEKQARSLICHHLD